MAGPEGPWGVLQGTDVLVFKDSLQRLTVAGPRRNCTCFPVRARFREACTLGHSSKCVKRADSGLFGLDAHAGQLAS